MKDAMKTKKQLIDELITLRKQVAEGEVSKDKEESHDELLLKNGERFRYFVENANDIIYSLTPDSIFTYVSPNWTEILGHDIYEVVGQSFESFVHPEDIPLCRVFLERVIATGEKHAGVEYRVRHKTGAWRWHTSNASPVRDADGNIITYMGIARDITERKRAEEALRESEEKYRLVVENAGEAISIIQDGVRKFVNRRAVELLGYSEEELTSKPFTEFVHPDDREMVFERHVKRMKNENVPSVYTSRIIAKDGAVKWVETHTTLISWNGEPAALVFFIEVSDRKRAEDTLRASEEKYRTIMENIEDGYYEVDISGNFTVLNESMCKILGYEREELVGKNNRQYTDEENSRKVYPIYNRVYQTGEPVKNFEWQIIRKDGTCRDNEVSISLIRNVEGHKTGFRGIARDTTYRKQAEKALRESEELYKTLAESSFAAVFIVQDGKLAFINTSAIFYAGYTAEELIGQSSDKIVHPDDKELIRIKNREMLAGRSNQAFDFRIITKQNQIRWISQTVTPINYRGRRAILGNAMDITDNRRMEEELQENERKYRYLYQEFRAILNAIPSAVLLSPDLKVVWANEGAATSINISPPDIIGQYCYKVRHSRSEPCEMCPVLECFTSGKPASGESVTPDGRVWELHAMPIFGDQGEVKGVIEAPLDISVRKQAEEARYHHEKIRGVLEMAGAICHEMNQPMQIISGYSEMLLMNISESDPIHTKLDTINKQVHRMATITRKLMKIKDYETQDYAGFSRIIDINKSSGKDTE
jgi:PAS domain S-box-containing protein